MDVVLTFCASWTKSVPPESHVTTIGLSLTSHISNFPSNRNMQYAFFLLFNLYVVVCHSLKWDIYTLCIIICVFFRAILLQILLTEKVRFIRVFILNFEHGLNETIDVTWVDDFWETLEILEPVWLFKGSYFGGNLILYLMHTI